MHFISLLVLFVFTFNMVVAAPTPYNRETNARFNSLESRATLVEARASEIEDLYEKVSCINVVETSAMSATAAVINLAETLPAGAMVEDAWAYTNEASSTPSGGVSTFGITCYSVSDNITITSASTNEASGVFIDNVSTRSKVSANGCTLRGTVGSTSGGITSMDLDVCVRYNDEP